MQLDALSFKETAAATHLRKLAREIDAQAFCAVALKTANPDFPHSEVPKPKILGLSSLAYVHDVSVEQRPGDTGQTYAEFYSHPTPHGECLLVVKPGRKITGRFAPISEPMTQGAIHSALADMYRETYIPATMRKPDLSHVRGFRPDKSIRYARDASAQPVSTFSRSISSNMTGHRPFEQLTRDKLAELFFGGFGLGQTFAPILPIVGQHKNFLLAASVVLGSGKSDLMFDGQYDPRWYANDYDAHNQFVPLLVQHEKLWSLICANLLARAVLGDKNYNLGAHVMMSDNQGQVAPYSVDAGKAFEEMDSGLLCEAINSAEIIEKCTNAKLAAEQGAPERADIEVMLEVLHNIYDLSSQAIRRNVEAVREMVPYFIIEKERTPVEVCEAFEKSRRELATVFNSWAVEQNRLTGLDLFDSIPAMPKERWREPASSGLSA